MSLIGCRGCDETNCEGCNVFTLAEMLHKGELDCLMDEYHSIVITPETLRPKGRWGQLRYDDGFVYALRCSECHKLVREFTNYCPNCGAKMEV